MSSLLILLFIVLHTFVKVTPLDYSYQWCEYGKSCQNIPTRTCLTHQTDVSSDTTYVIPPIGSTSGLSRISVTRRSDIEIAIETRSNYGSVATETIVAEIIRILLTEAMGFSVSITQTGDFDGDFLTRCGKTDSQTDFYLEQWGLDDNTPEEWARALSSGVRIIGPSGMIANNGWYITGFTVRRYLNKDMDFWRAYTRDDVIALLPQVNATWAKTETSTGRTYFIPPQCDPEKGGKPVCGMFWGVSPFWDQGVIQGQIRNLNLSLILVFPKDFDDYMNVVESSQQNKTALLFELWTPSMEELTWDVKRVQLPPATPSCYANRNQSMEGINSIDCDFTATLIAKMACPRASVRYTNPSHLITGSAATTYFTPSSHVYRRSSDRDDSMSIISSFFYRAGDVPVMMDKARQNPNLTTFDLACQYLLHERMNDWPVWVQSQTTRTYLQSINTSTQTASYVMVALYGAINLMWIVLTVWYRKEGVIRATSSRLRICHLVGGLFLYAAFVLGIDRSSSGTCMGSQLMLSIGFHMFYSVLILKAQRIDHIFLATKLHVARVTDQKLMTRLVTLTLPDLIITSIWWIANPIKVDISQHDRDQHLMIHECTISQYSLPFLILLYIYRGIMLGVGLVIAYRIRKVNGHWNESKLILLATYHSVLAALLGVATSIGWIGNDTNLTTILYLICITIGVCIPSISNGIHIILSILRPDVMDDKPNHTRLDIQSYPNCKRNSVAPEPDSNPDGIQHVSYNATTSSKQQNDTKYKVHGSTVESIS